MSMPRRYLLLLAFILAALPAMPRAASAAPFCVNITGMPPQCLYFDPGECRERAHQLNGLCSANPDELKIVKGSGRYCLVNASRATLCIYPDIQSCNTVALKEVEAVCVDGEEKVDKVGEDIDPYRTEPDRRY